MNILRLVKSIVVYLLVISALLLMSLWTVEICSAQCIPGQQKVLFQVYKPVRPDVTTGFGQLIDDLESHTTAGHNMRNEKDPGNWVHELTHQVNSDIRNKTSAHDNAFYVFADRYILLREPKVTMRQVAAMVPEKSRGRGYKTYLIDSQRWWNYAPLNVLDEATAFVNSLEYHAVTQTKDATRVEHAGEFLNYIDSLVRAIEKYDPHYTDMAALKAYVAWHKVRMRDVLVRYDGGTVKPAPIPPYILTARYHVRKRTNNFFKKLKKVGEGK